MHTAHSLTAAHRASLLTLLMKRGIDIVCCLLFFGVFGWLYVVLGVGVRLSSSGSALYSQPRLGRHGKVFRFYKFRSMVDDADLVLRRHLASNPAARQEWEVFQKLRNDPRVTPFGAFIRKYSLDELPQLWNVLRGDMSLVGPRPCMFAQQELYGEYWSLYCTVRPGLTGLWQTHGRNKVSYRRRAAMDAAYVASLSIGTDIAILLRTVGVVLRGDGAS